MDYSLGVHMPSQEAPIALSNHNNLLETQDSQREHLGTLSVAEIIGSSFDDTEDLGFDRAQAFALEPAAQGQDRLLELRFEGEPIRDDRFLRLLQAIAPMPLQSFFPDHDKASFILGDWLVFDQPDDSMRELAAMHSGLKGWAQLGREYQDIKAALEPIEDRYPLPWMLPANEKIVKPAEFIMSWGDAESLANHDPLINSSELFQLLADIYDPEYARSQIVQAMSHAVKDRPSDPERAALKDLNDEELLAAFHTMGIEERNRLVSVSALQSNYKPGSGRRWTRDERTERFTATYIKRHCVPFETDDGQVMYAHGLAPDEDIERAYATRQKIYGYGDRPRHWVFDRGIPYECETMEVDTVIGRQTVIIPGSVKFQELGLIPSVRWSVGKNGTRTHQDLPEHPPATSYKHNVLSGVAGLMVLAYLQPEKRSRWMKTGRLPGSEFEQEMGPAQVPLLALQQAGRLLNNELMQEAESLV
jgi:hypothetical protein